MIEISKGIFVKLESIILIDGNCVSLDCKLRDEDGNVVNEHFIVNDDVLKEIKERLRKD